MLPKANIFQQNPGVAFAVRRNVIYSIYVFDAAEIKPVNSTHTEDAKSEDKQVETKEKSSVSAA